MNHRLSLNALALALAVPALAQQDWQPQISLKDVAGKADKMKSAKPADDCSGGCGAGYGGGNAGDSKFIRARWIGDPPMLTDAALRANVLNADVKLRFMLHADGSISGLKVVRDPGFGLANAVVKDLPSHIVPARRVTSAGEDLVDSPVDLIVHFRTSHPAQNSDLRERVDRMTRVEKTKFCVKMPYHDSILGTTTDKETCLEY